MVLLLMFLLVSLLLIGIPITQTFLKKEELNDLLFLVFSNGVFILSTLIFGFHLEEVFLTVCSSFFLTCYSLFLILELKKENKKFHILEVPYFLFTLCLPKVIANIKNLNLLGKTIVLDAGHGR